MSDADQLAAALQALLDDPRQRAQAEAALTAYRAAQQRRERYRQLAAEVVKPTS